MFIFVIDKIEPRMETEKRASELEIGTLNYISRLQDSDLQINLLEIGIRVGKSIILQHKAPFGGALAFEIAGVLVCMRPSEASLIFTSPTFIEN
jgi:Fe2+ transport system protein FeoA